MNEYCKEINSNAGATNESKKKKKKNGELWIKIGDLIKLITKKSDD